jgi:hypothetical protein
MWSYGLTWFYIKFQNLKKVEGIYRLRWVPEGACPSWGTSLATWAVGPPSQLYPHLFPGNIRWIIAGHHDCGKHHGIFFVSVLLSLLDIIFFVPKKHTFIDLQSFIYYKFYELFGNTKIYSLNNHQDFSLENFLCSLSVKIIFLVLKFNEAS